MEKFKDGEMYISPDVDHVFRLNTVYDIRTNAKNMTIDKKITIRDIKCNESIPLRCHVNGAAMPRNFYMTLTSSTGEDIRNYLVNFQTAAVRKSLCRF